MTTITADAIRIEHNTWTIDPERSHIEFEVPNVWGLTKVSGSFDRYHGTLDLRHEPAIALAIDAGSLTTGNARRDKHLRSEDFFGTDAHPRVEFVSETATLAGERLTATGELRAGGASAPLSVSATVRRAGPELEIEATAEVDQRRLGMTFSPLGLVGTPTKLIVRGRLVSD
jgi:polyisoprenoid-binding protein YceI